MTKAFIKSHIVCIATMLLLFLGAEWIVDPTVDSPLNDDWSYAHSVLHLQQTGKIDIGYWPAMTLVAHILWGNCFVSLFGFSHLVLRISTLCLSAVTIVLLYILLFRLSRNCRSSVFTTLFLVFNPIWFLLSNSFMTDVPFLFAVTLALYSAQQVITKNNNFHLLVFSFACVYALLIRQFGMALPVAWFIFTCFSVITRRIRLRQALLYLVPVLLSALTYLVFERWVVDHLPEGSAYQSASRITKDFTGICSKFSENFVHRFSQSLLYLGLFLFPLTAYGAYTRLKEGSWRQRWLLVIPAVAVSVLLVQQLHQFPIGNSLYNCGLGLQSVYDVTVLQTNTSHTYSAFFEFGAEFFGMLGAVGLLILMTFGIRPMIRPLAKDQVNHAFDGFLVLMALIYFLLLGVSQSFFDRYTLPLLLPVLLLCRHFFVKKPARVVACFYLFSVGCFSVFATKDYFAWHRARIGLIQKAVARGIPASEVNGGFEYEAMNFYDGAWWSYWVGETTSYKVTCGPIVHHRLVDQVVYQRAIPWQKDTLFLYQREVPEP